MGLWEALTKGEGTPWGPASTGRPDLPAMDPSAYGGFDTTPLATAGRAKIGRNSAQAREQALASLRKAGVRGADTGAALAGVQARQAEALGNLDAQLAMMDYQTRQANRDAALKKYEYDLMANAGENQGRGQFWNSLASLGGGALGAWLGGK